MPRHCQVSSGGCRVPSVTQELLKSNFRSSTRPRIMGDTLSVCQPRLLARGTRPVARSGERPSPKDVEIDSESVVGAIIQRRDTLAVCWDSAMSPPESRIDPTCHGPPDASQPGDVVQRAPLSTLKLPAIVPLGHRAVGQITGVARAWLLWSWPCDPAQVNRIIWSRAFRNCLALRRNTPPRGLAPAGRRLGRNDGARGMSGGPTAGVG